MKFETAVRNARSPQEAMLALARALDEIQAQLVGRSDDAWFGDWPSESTGGNLPRSVPVPAPPAVWPSEQIDALQAALNAETDPDERQALEAKLRLAKESGRVPEPPVEQGAPSVFDEFGNVILPPATQAQMASRARFVVSHPVHEFYPEMDPEELREAFVKGGPLWLYHGDPRAMHKMPDDWKRAFIDDIEQSSPAQAQEVARDILKDRGPNTQETTLDTLTAQTGS